MSISETDPQNKRQRLNDSDSNLNSETVSDSDSNLNSETVDDPFLPLVRKWQTIKKSSIRQSIKVMHFNVLADQLSDHEGFVGTSKRDMEWSVRSQRLLQIIIEAHQGRPIDVLSLVECDHYEDFWKPNLAKIGLTISHFARKNEIETKKTHGVALFIRETKFDVIGFHSITERVAIASVCVRERYENHILVFATTHLKAKPWREPIRRNQLNIIIQEYRSTVAHNIPLILMGDFNTNLNEVGMKTMMSSLKLRVPFQLPWTTWKERPANNWQPGGLVKRPIDYFFISSQIDPVEYLDCPDDHQVAEAGLLPGTRYPSDHLAIAFIFKF